MTNSKDDKIDDNSSSANNLHSSFEDISSIDNASLDFSIPSKPNKIKGGNVFDKLFSYMNNINLESQRKFSVVYMKSGLVKFSKYLIKKNSKRRYIYVALLAIAVAVITIFLTQNSGLYSSGFSGVFQGVARIVQASLLKLDYSQHIISIVYNVIFWTMYLFANIPLMIFAYKKISKEFAYLTFVYIFTNQIFGFCLSLIPNIQEVTVFGSTNAEESLNGVIIQLTSWDGFQPFLLLIYAIVSGLLCSIPYTLIYIFSGSTGGSDIVSIYYAKEKNKNIGSMLILINIICILVAATLGSFGSKVIIHGNSIWDNTDEIKIVNNVIQSILSPNLVFSVIMISIIGSIVNWFFPKTKFVQVKVFTNNIEGIKNKLNEVGYKHDIYFNQLMNVGCNSSTNLIETVCMYIELPDLLANIRLIDKTSVITINRLSDIDGEMYILR